MSVCLLKFRHGEEIIASVPSPVEDEDTGVEIENPVYLVRDPESGQMIFAPYIPVVYGDKEKSRKFTFKLEDLMFPPMEVNEHINDAYRMAHGMIATPPTKKLLMG